MPVARPATPEPLAGVIQNFRFAKQRFDSTATPVVNVCLMLLPLATLLAYVSSDARNEREQRDRAHALLLKLNTKFCIGLAISADWGVICQWFLRLFDAANHDIAKSRVEIDAMIETIDAVFTAGVLFKKGILR